MDKEAILSVITKKTGIRKDRVRLLFEAFVRTAQEALMRDDRVPLTGLGMLKTIKITQRMTRNPKTGMPQPVKAKRRISFKPNRNIRRF